jgi:Tol biopolymer transport system component
MEEKLITKNRIFTGMRLLSIMLIVGIILPACQVQETMRTLTPTLDTILENKIIFTETPGQKQESIENTETDITNSPQSQTPALEEEPKASIGSTPTTYKYLAFPEVGLIVLGHPDRQLWDIYQVDLPCWEDSLECNPILANIFERNDLDAWEFHISPDGQKMIFISDYLSENSRTDIFIYTFEGNKLSRITDTSYYESLISWSSSGNYIAYTADDDRIKWIQVADVYGNVFYDIRTSHLNSFKPAWSDNEKMIAFFSNDGPFTTNILYYYDFESHQNVELPVENIDDYYKVVWSPDNEKIAYITDHAGAPGICIVEIKTSENHCLTNTPQGERYPAWSPDGDKIAYSRFNDNREQSSIWLMNSDGSDKVEVSVEDGYYYDPIWVSGSEFILCSKKINGVLQPILIQVHDHVEIRLVLTSFDVFWLWIGQE